MSEPTAATITRNSGVRFLKSQVALPRSDPIDSMAQLIVIGHLLVLADTNLLVVEAAPARLARVRVLHALGVPDLRHHLAPPQQDYSFRDFLIERTARLWVCLVPALAFSALVASLVLDLPDYPATPHTGPIHFIGNLLMLEDYPLFQILRRLGIDSIFFVRPHASAEPYRTLPIEFWLYVVFGYLFFYGYLRRGRPSWGIQALTAVALFAVVYHAATGYGSA